MNVYKEAILKSLSYFAIFQYPLTKKELWHYLLWEKKSPIQFSLFNRSLFLLEKNKLVLKKEALFYQLPSKINWAKKRKIKEKIASKKLALAKKTTRILSFIPTIKMIGLSGSLSLGIGEIQDDIDLFIICQKNTLWFSRLIINLLLIFLGLKRTPKSQKTKDKICPNMFMEEDKLTLPKNEQDLYSAHELAFIKPLFQKEDLYQRLIKANSWAKFYLPNAFLIFPNNYKTPKSNLLICFLNQILYKLQFNYMKSKITNEVITKHYVRFHPKDARYWILSKYNQQLLKLKKIKIK